MWKFYEELLSHFRCHNIQAFLCASQAEHAKYLLQKKNVLNESCREEWNTFYVHFVVTLSFCDNETIVSCVYIFEHGLFSYGQCSSEHTH
jgi:hypothetical protein